MNALVGVWLTLILVGDELLHLRPGDYAFVPGSAADQSLRRAFVSWQSIN